MKIEKKFSKLERIVFTLSEEDIERIVENYLVNNAYVPGNAEGLKEYTENSLLRTKLEFEWYEKDGEGEYDTTTELVVIFSIESDKKGEEKE